MFNVYDHILKIAKYDRSCCPDTEGHKMTEAKVSDAYAIPNKCLFPHTNN